jgi:hypothetical protein
MLTIYQVKDGKNPSNYLLAILLIGLIQGVVNKISLA